MPERFVYLIHTNKKSKIGKTSSLKNRLENYFSSNNEIKTIILKPTLNPEELEKYFLEKFNDKRIQDNRDWFLLSENDINEFINFDPETLPSEFNYIEKSEQPKKTIREKIIEILSNNNGHEINQTDIRAFCGSDLEVRKELSRMVQEGIIRFRFGRKGSHVYKLNNNVEKSGDIFQSKLNL